MSQQPFESAVELAKAIREKRVSSLEITDLYIDRIERYDPDINAVVVKDFERAREAARRADKDLAGGRAQGQLHGVPMTIKEAYDVEGLPTTWGVPELKNNIATMDADLVARFRQAGAHFLCKTNVPLNLGDFQSFNEIYGTTNNPWDLARSPGGSSGGSAAALAAGLTGLEAGSDIGGSIRNPSHFCGTYGHKPTWGVVSDRGHAFPGALAPADIAVVGPMGRSAEDLKVSMEVIAGAGRTEAVGWQLKLSAPRHKKLKEYRVAVWHSDVRAPVSHEISDRVQLVADKLATLGASVSDTARPTIDFDASHEVYQSLLLGEMASNMPDEQKDEMRAVSAALDPNDHSLAANFSRFAVQEHGTGQPTTTGATSSGNRGSASLRTGTSCYVRRWRPPPFCTTTVNISGVRSRLITKSRNISNRFSGRGLSLSLTCQARSSPPGHRARACPLGYRRSVQNSMTTRRSTSRDCWQMRLVVSCRRLPMPDTRF